MTNRQRRFVEEYLVCLNATEAARRAGYSFQYANRIGYRLLRNVEVQSAIEERRQIMASEKILTATDLQEFLSCVIRGEVNDVQLMTRLTGRGCSVVEKHEFTAATKDRLRACELLGKMIGAFNQSDTSDGASIFLSTMEKIFSDKGDSASATA